VECFNWPFATASKAPTSAVVTNFVLPLNSCSGQRASPTTFAVQPAYWQPRTWNSFLSISGRLGLNSLVRITPSQLRQIEFEASLVTQSQELRSRPSSGKDVFLTKGNDAGMAVGPGHLSATQLSQGSIRWPRTPTPNDGNFVWGNGGTKVPGSR